MKDKKKSIANLEDKSKSTPQEPVEKKKGLLGWFSKKSRTSSDLKSTTQATQDRSSTSGDLDSTTVRERKQNISIDSPFEESKQFSTARGLTLQTSHDVLRPLEREEPGRKAATTYMGAPLTPVINPSKGHLHPHPLSDKSLHYTRFDSSEVGVDFDMRKTDQKREQDKASSKPLAHPELVGYRLIDKIQEFWKQFGSKVDKKGRFNESSLPDVVRALGEFDKYFTQLKHTLLFVPSPDEIAHYGGSYDEALNQLK
jgi:hypothetical protein